jgi:hypothetical protein
LQKAKRFFTFALPKPQLVDWSKERDAVGRQPGSRAKESVFVGRVGAGKKVYKFIWIIG